MALLLGVVFLGVSSIVSAADVREIELRRLFEPTPSELAQEEKGRIYIYDGLRDKDVQRAMEQEFDRVENMMFIREKKDRPNRGSTKRSRDRRGSG